MRFFHAVGHRWNWSSAQNTDLCSCSGPPEEIGCVDLCMGGLYLKYWDIEDGKNLLQLSLSHRTAYSNQGWGLHSASRRG